MAPGRRLPAPATDHHPAIGQEVTCRTVAELRHYLADLPGDSRVEGPGSAEMPCCWRPCPAGTKPTPPLVVLEPITLDNAGEAVMTTNSKPP